MQDKVVKTSEVALEKMQFCGIKRDRKCCFLRFNFCLQERWQILEDMQYIHIGFLFILQILSSKNPVTTKTLYPGSRTFVACKFQIRSSILHKLYFSQMWFKQTLQKATKKYLIFIHKAPKITLKISILYFSIDKIFNSNSSIFHYHSRLPKDLKLGFANEISRRFEIRTTLSYTNYFSALRNRLFSSNLRQYRFISFAFSHSNRLMFPFSVATSVKILF